MGAGTRVPAFFYSPSESLIPQVNRGQRSPILAHITDLHPTLALLGGSALPEAERERLDGLDLWPQLISGGEQGEGRREVLYNIDPIGLPPPGYRVSCEEGFESSGGWFANAALRVDRWKLVWCRDVDGAGTGADHYWLYDIEADPGEATDRGAEEPEVLARLRLRLQEWWAEQVPPIQGTAPSMEDWRRAEPRDGVLDWPVDARAGGGQGGGPGARARASMI